MNAAEHAELARQIAILIGRVRAIEVFLGFVSIAVTVCALICFAKADFFATKASK